MRTGRRVPATVQSYLALQRAAENVHRAPARPKFPGERWSGNLSAWPLPMRFIATWVAIIGSAEEVVEDRKTVQRDSPSNAAGRASGYRHERPVHLAGIRLQNIDRL